MLSVPPLISQSEDYAQRRRDEGVEKGDDYDDSLSSMRDTARMEEGYRRNLLGVPELSEVRCSSP